MEDSAFMGAEETEVGRAQVQAHGGSDRDAVNEQGVKAKRSRVTVNRRSSVGSDWEPVG